MTVEGEHTLRAGRQVEFQFALPGANFNLRGTGQVDKVVKLAIGPTRTILSIVEMNKNQRGVLREWLVAREQAEAVQLPTKKPPPPSV